MSDLRKGAGLGASVDRNLTRFRVFTTTAEHCAVRLFDREANARDTRAMQARGDGLFELAADDAPHGTLYKFVLDGRELPDPYARFLPQGVHGPAMVVDSRYVWQHGPGVARPLSEQVLYELHIGTFTELGTYNAARGRLEELSALGITTLELMPLSAFAGRHGWGYDGVMHFAPFAPYGTPDELRQFVDDAHGLGLSLLLDVVYNHFGPSGNHLTAYSPDYFTRDIQNAWGDAPNFAHPAMRSYVLDNVRYWLEELRFDGLRLDAVHAIVDPSDKHVLRELVETARALFPGKVLIGEDDRNDPALVSKVGLDALWADDFHHQVRVTLTGERDGYYAAYKPSVGDLARAIEHGWLYEGQIYPPSGKQRGKPATELCAASFVYCIQNHDQVGNRALGDRLTTEVSLEEYCMASALLLFLPMTPLLFMGQEWAASTPFCYFTDHDPELGAKVSRGRREEFKHFRAFSDPEARTAIPDPQDRGTFERSRLCWQEREEPAHRRVLALYRALLSLRRTDPVLRVASRKQLSARSYREVLVVRRWHGREERVLLASFAREPISLATLGIPKEATLLLDTAETSSGSELAPRQAQVLALARPLAGP